MSATNNGEYTGQALEGKFLGRIEGSTGIEAWK